MTPDAPSRLLSCAAALALVICAMPAAAQQTDQPHVSLDLMNPVIQAEIALQVARQVAVALQRERLRNHVAP